MRHSYHTSGLTDLEAIQRYAKDRDEPTTVHLHPFYAELGEPTLCNLAGCYVVEGRAK